MKFRHHQPPGFSVTVLRFFPALSHATNACYLSVRRPEFNPTGVCCRGRQTDIGKDFFSESFGSPLPLIFPLTLLPPLMCAAHWTGQQFVIASVGFTFEPIFMEQSPSWEPAANSTIQEIFSLVWSPGVNRHLYKSQPLDPILTQFNPGHIWTVYFCKIHFNNILLSTCTSPDVLFSFHVFRQNFCTHFLSPPSVPHVAPWRMGCNISIINKPRQWYIYKQVCVCVYVCWLAVWTMCMYQR
jgi:hypothetical protein